MENKENMEKTYEAPVAEIVEFDERDTMGLIFGSTQKADQRNIVTW